MTQQHRLTCSRDMPGIPALIRNKWGYIFKFFLRSNGCYLVLQIYNKPKHAPAFVNEKLHCADSHAKLSSVSSTHFTTSLLLHLTIPPQHPSGTRTAPRHPALTALANAWRRPCRPFLATLNDPAGRRQRSAGSSSMFRVTFGSHLLFLVYAFACTRMHFQYCFHPSTDSQFYQNARTVQ